jgi:hypothetical protein
MSSLIVWSLFLSIYKPNIVSKFARFRNMGKERWVAKLVARLIAMAALWV